MMRLFHTEKAALSFASSGLKVLRCACALGVLAALAGCGGGGDSSSNSSRFVFVGTNHNNTKDASQPPNQITMYNRGTDGTLTLIGSIATGGQGSGPGQRFAGDGLGASHSVQLSQDKKWLFVTNAGSNNVTVFKLLSNGLQEVDIKPTGDGTPDHRFPNSVTQRGNFVYVLNSADNGSITGFTLSSTGILTAIPNSTRGLNANQPRFTPDAVTNPAQVAFSPDGAHLIVSIKDGSAAGAIPGVTPTGPGRLLVFNVDANGLPSSNFVETDLANNGPFGFSFDRSGNMLVALFIGGTGLTGSAGSFHINADGSLTPISRNVGNGQLDSCWLENNGSFAYTANYTTNNISSYTIGANGSLTLLNQIAGTTVPSGLTQGPTPLDLAVTSDGNFLYNVLPGSGKVAGWRINSDGSLTKIGEFAGLPQTVNGDNGPVDFGGGGSPAGIVAN